MEKYQTEIDFTDLRGPKVYLKPTKLRFNGCGIEIKGPSSVRLEWSDETGERYTPLNVDSKGAIWILEKQVRQLPEAVQAAIKNLKVK